MFSSFLFRSSNFPQIFCWNLHLNHRKAHLILSSFILSHHPFVTGVLHGGSSWFNLFFKSSSRFCWWSSSIFSSHLEVQLSLHILLKWSFAFLRSSKLSNHFRLWPVITLCSWDVIYKTTTSLFFRCWFSQQLRSTFPSKFFSFNSFNSFRRFCVMSSSSIIPSSLARVLFIHVSAGVLPKFFCAYSFSILF